MILYDELIAYIAPPDGFIKRIEEFSEIAKHSNGHMPPVLIRYKDVFQFYFYGLYPLLRLAEYYSKNKFDIEILEEIENNPGFDRGILYKAKEQYSILIQCDPEVVAYIVGKITNQANTYETLCEAIENENESLFVDTIRLNNLVIPPAVNRLLYGMSTFDREHLYSRVSASLDNKEILDAKDTINNHKKRVQKDCPDPFIDEVYECIAHMSELCNWWTVTLDSLEKIWDELFSVTGRYYKRFFINRDFGSHHIQEVLNSITTRPEVAQYFKEWEREYEYEQKQTGTKPLDNETISCNEDEFHLSNSIWKDAQPLKNKNNAYEQTIFGFKISPNQIEAIFEVLVDCGCIDNTQSNLDLLATRLSKKAIVPENKLSPITWYGEKKDLCYFIQRIAKVDSSGAGTFFARSEHYFVYSSGEQFTSKSASAYALNPTTEFKDKLEKAILISR